MINNILTCIKTLLQQTKNPNLETIPLMIGAEVENLIEETPSDANLLTDEVIDAIDKIWQDPSIQKVYEQRSKFQLVDNAGYFLNRMQLLKEQKMIPNLQDILHIRVRTTGIAETNFKIGETKFQMMDVGGQRNERKKWIHCFDHVTAVIFVTALSEYDQMLAEVDKVNRMDESISLFAEICNSRWFRDAGMILFLNKRDLFEKKIQLVPLSVCQSFSDFDGPQNSYDAAILYIQDKFLERTQRLVYTHITCATDTKHIEIVFNVVKETIIRNALKTYGLM